MVALLLAGLKALLPAMVALIVPVVSFIVYYKFVDFFISIALGAIGEIGGISLAVTGLGGWVCSQLRMSECISLYLAAVTLGFCLKLVRR